MTTDTWLEQMLAEDKQRRERLPTIKAILCDALKARGITAVSIEYDGEGDSGQVNEILVFDDQGCPANLDQPVTLPLHKPEEPTTYTSLREALDDFAWTTLDVYHGGFENNEGGFGSITIDATKGTMTIDHNDRIIELANTVTET